MKKLGALILITSLLLATFANAVTASPTIYDVSGKENRGITVTYNNEPQTLRDGNGNIVYPVIINGTTYLPVRSVASMLECDITWNSKTQTVGIAKNIEDESSVPTDLKDVADDSSDNVANIPTEISLGLNREDIFKMYGNPEYIYWNQNHRWEYKRYNSSISFDNNWKVTGWDNPPKVGFDNKASSKIFLGMTKDEVNRIYGTPVYVDPNTPYQWEYIRYNSYVWFDKEWKVIGWQYITKDLEVR